MRFNKRNTAAVVLGLVWALVLSCNDGSDNDSVPKISNTGRIIAVDELLTTSFKKLREYGTDGLPGAMAVVHGFLRDGSDAFDYEVRFYKSHVEAVELGTPLAEEGSGPNAVIREDDALYKEGIRDRRMVIEAGSGGTVGPKYGGYVIYENLVLLCQGIGLEQSLERCGLLAKVLQPTE